MRKFRDDSSKKRREVTPEPSLDHESSAVQKHLEIMQGVITRMAENSRSCKVWCVTLVAAVLVLVAQTGEPRHALIALFPTLMFYVLDAYYLMLERRFRKSYKTFVVKIQTGEACKSELFNMPSEGSKVRGFLWAMFRSFSVMPFYSAVFATVLLACLVIL